MNSHTSSLFKPHHLLPCRHRHTVSDVCLCSCVATDDGEVRRGRPNRADERAEATHEAAGAQESRRAAAERQTGAVRQGAGTFSTAAAAVRVLLRNLLDDTYMVTSYRRLKRNL